MLNLIGISKKFKNTTILNNISYTFKEGEIYTIRGKNGAGKTVLLKLLCGLMDPTNGKIEYLNKETKVENGEFGIIIENPIFWKDKTGYETLKFFGPIKNIINNEQINITLERVGLKDASNIKIKKYSLGMRQRLAIAQAIMENPNILLFDEPTNSLDDEGVEMFKKIILEEKNKGKIVIIVTHNIEDVSDITDKILYLKNCKLSEEQ